MYHSISTVNATTPRRPAVAHSLLATIAIATAAPACHATTGETTMPTNSSVTTPSAPNKHGYLAANGLRYYYEIHGSGEPLLMLHGGLGSTELFEPGLAELAKERQVIAVDLHGHGRTELGDREISLIDQGNDMAEIVQQLGFQQLDVIGYSLGGGVALRLVVQHPGSGAPPAARDRSSGSRASCAAWICDCKIYLWPSQNGSDTDALAARIR